MADHEHSDEGEGRKKSHGGGAGHGAAHEEHEGVPEWMISFADNTALMMGLFVILLAMNMGPKAKSVMGGEKAEKSPTEATANNDMLDFVLSLREAFNNPVKLDSSNPQDELLRKRLKEREGSENGSEVSAEDEGKEGAAVRPSDYNDVGARIDFEDGSALLTATGKQSIADAAKRLADTRYIIDVRGHTSPFETFRNIEKGLDLSLERARVVAREMVVQGVKWGQIRISGSGDNERLVERTFDRNVDGANQRVEVILTKELMGAEPGGKK